WAGRAKALPAFRDRHLTGSPPGHPAAPRSCDRLPPAHVWGLSRMSRSAVVFAAVLTLVFGLVPLPAAQAAEAPELSPKPPPPSLTCRPIISSTKRCRGWPTKASREAATHPETTGSAPTSRS